MSIVIVLSPNQIFDGHLKQNGSPAIGINGYWDKDGSGNMSLSFMVNWKHKNSKESNLTAFFGEIHKRNKAKLILTWLSIYKNNADEIAFTKSGSILLFNDKYPSQRYSIQNNPFQDIHPSTYSRIGSDLNSSVFRSN